MTTNNSPTLDINNANLETLIKLIVLLYADDTVVFAKSEENLIQAMDIFANYCDRWKLQINYDKTKAMVFGERPNRRRHIVVNGHNVEFLSEFNYLGVYFTQNRSFVRTKKYAADQGRKAMFSLLKKIRNLELSMDCQLKLFDHTVVPILLYGCEIWGFGDLSFIEKVHIDFLKYILHVKKVHQML